MIKKIANFGAFDHDSYGDLLFPFITEFFLPSDEYQIIHISPSGKSTSWPDERNAISIDEAFSITDWDGVIISGGDIIHVSEGFSAHWKSDPYLSIGALTGIWIGASILATKLSIPLVWNAPGVPFEMPIKFVDLVKNILQSADYISVRDKYSRKNLALYTDKEIHVIPDSAIQVNELWPIEDQYHLKRDYFTISVSLSDLYCRKTDLTKTTNNLKDMLGARITVLPLMNWQLSDYTDTHAPFEFIKENISILPRSLLIKECARIIASSKGYIGNSLHGYITAAAYQVPAILVIPHGAAHIHKYTGFMEAIGQNPDKTLAKSWEEAFELFKLLPPLGESGGKLLNKTCEIHWANIQSIFSAPKQSKNIILEKIDSIINEQSNKLIAFGITPSILLDKYINSKKEILNHLKLQQDIQTEILNHLKLQQDIQTEILNEKLQYTAQIEEFENKLDLLENENLEQKNHINEKNNTINLLFSSKSWKMTKPLRTISYYTSNYYEKFCHFKRRLFSKNLIESQNTNKTFHNLFVDKNTNEFLSDPIVKAIAFYLPQFHPFKENDQWWGKGFTEWTNVSKAKPQFKGHYQPHLPDELGFYDLRLTSEIMKQQVELAKLYGVHGFCFYHYWFDGKRLMELPVNNFLKDKSLDINFCLCWANENWSRRWDGLDNDILIAQNHSPEDDNAFFEDILPALKDSRYIRIDNKPILLIYRANLLPDPKNTAALWREKALKNGLEGLYLIAVNSFDITTPKAFNFDACVEFPPHQLGIINSPLETVTLLNPNYEGALYDYALLPNQFGRRENNHYTQFKCVMPSWDNEARKPNKGTTFINSSPELYKVWLKNALDITLKKRKEEQLLFINAWNEWAEGTHLEPCKKYGYAYLDATREILCDATQSILLVTHDCHPHGAQFLILSMAKEFKKLGYSINIIILGDGPLLNDFIEVGSVISFFQKDSNYIHNQLVDIYKTTKNVIANTVVSGQIVEQLNIIGFNILTLIHELPNIIREFKQEKNAEAIAEFSHKIVFPAELVKEKFCEIAPISLEKIIIQHQGLLRQNPYKNRFNEAYKAVCRKHNLNENAEIILNIGYADSRKGADLFIDIATIVIKSRPNAIFIWVGHQEKDFSNTVKQLGLEKNIHFVGFDKDPMMYYVAASAYALTSREDPFPNVVLESIEVGVPIVAFRGATGTEDYIVENKGKLARAFDINDFSTQLCNLLNEKNVLNAKSYSLNKYCIDLLYSLNLCPKISVIVPNYNYERHIIPRLESIFKQTFPIYEVIILDDKSTDNSVGLIKSFLENNQYDAQLIINNENSGSVFKQWKQGIKLSEGNLIWIAEADDLAEPNLVAELATSFNDQNVVLAFSQSKQIDKKDNIIADNYLEYTKDVSNCYLESYKRSGQEEIRDTLCIKNTIPNVSSVLFQKNALIEALQEIGDDILQYKVAGDWIIYLHILLKGKIFYNRKALNLHRRHITSVTQSTKKENHLNEVISAQEIAKNLAINLSDEKKCAAKNYVKQLYDYFNIPQLKD